MYGSGGGLCSLFVWGYPVYPTLLWFFYWSLPITFFPLISILDGGLFFLCLVGSTVYSFFLIGFSSKSKYSHLGAIRSTAQSLTFEVSFFFLVLSYFFVTQNLEFQSFGSLSQLPLVYFWLMYLVVELGRAPVDFPESESETVSGYNLEYGGVFFTIIFLSEYGYLLFYSALLTSLFLSFSGFSFYVLLTFIIVLRGALPRYRYDQLMSSFWVVLLPVSIQMLLCAIVLLYHWNLVVLSFSCFGCCAGRVS